jgi:hypothetical protein
MVESNLVSIGIFDDIVETLATGIVAKYGVCNCDILRSVEDFNVATAVGSWANGHGL